LVDPQSPDQRTEDGGAAASDRSDRCVTTQPGDFEVEDTRWDRKACVEAKQVCCRWASIRWSDDKDFWIRPRGACISKGILDFRLPPYNPRGERMVANYWNPSSFGFPIFPSYFP
jgi:hypothetical protein